jgi:hypothetical protein
LLLERKSYISPHQSAGLLYSPAMLSAFEQRAAALSDLADPRWWTLEEIRIEAQPKGDVSREALAEICRAPDLGFLVLETDVGNSSTSMTMQETLRDVYLYDCAAIRLEGTT